jgi:hypothetical protein
VRTWRSLLYGSLTPRRHTPRRDTDVSIVSVDWHHPQWLAVALLTLVLSVADAVLTLTLLERGAYEANPLMASLIYGPAWLFAVTKIGLTAAGIVLLTLMARLRLFGSIRVSVILYLVLLTYSALVGYELWLLRGVPVLFEPG